MGREKDDWTKVD